MDKNRFVRVKLSLKWLALVFFLGMCSATYAQLSLGNSGDNCTNRTDVSDPMLHIYYLNVYIQGTEGCNPTIQSLDKWFVTPEPATKEDVFGNYKQIRLSWNSNSVITPVIYVEYSCEQGSQVSQQLHLTLGPAMVQNVSLSLSTNSITQGAPVTLTASGTNGGTSPNYSYFVNNSEVCHECGTSYVYENCNAPVGTVPVFVVMKGNEICRVPHDGKQSSSVNLSIGSKPHFTAMLNPPVQLCGEAPLTKPFSVTTTPSPTPGQLDYSWSTDNGNSYTAGLLEQNLTLYAASIVKVQVSPHFGVCATVTSPSAWSPTFIPIVDPTVTLTHNLVNYCPGDTIRLEASSAFASAGTSYVWKINGGTNVFHTGPSAKIVTSATSENNGPGYKFYNGSAITVTANSFAGTCLNLEITEVTKSTAGTSLSVYPMPQASASASPICSGTAVSASISDGNVGGTTTTFSWEASQTDVSGALAGSGATINQTLTATSTTANGSVTYGIIPTQNGCTGPVFNLIVDVKRAPIVTNSSEQLATSVCSGTQLSFTPSMSVSGSVYSWTSSTFGLISSGVTSSGFVPITDTPINSSNTGASVTYAITPSFNLCPGPPANYVASIKPLPTVFADPGPTVGICSGSAVDIALSNPNNIAGTAISWMASQSASTGASEGAGNSISQILSSSPATATGTATYVVTGTVNGCYSLPKTVVVTINPIPGSVGSVTGNRRFGTGSLTMDATGATAGETYEWYNSSAEFKNIGSQFSTPSFSSSATNAYYVEIVKISSGCPGPQHWIDVGIYTTPVISASSDHVYMGATSTLSTSAYDAYVWKNALGSTVATTGSHETNIPDTYTVQVTVDGTTTTSAPFKLMGQLDNQNLNYIVTTNALVKEITSASLLQQQPIDKASQTIEYFDGLGRPMQTVATRASPLMNDIVQQKGFDQYGREAYKYLPFVSGNNGQYKPGILGSDALPSGIAASFYLNSADNIADDSAPYSKTLFETSELGRPIEVGAPGSSFQPGTGHTIMQSYLLNGANEILKFKFDFISHSISWDSDHYFPANQLTATKVVDEQNGEVITYTDKEGRTVCKRVKASPTEYADTYYVFDRFGNLVIVLPPEAIKRILEEL